MSREEKSFWKRGSIVSGVVTALVAGAMIIFVVDLIPGWRTWTGEKTATCWRWLCSPLLVPRGIVIAVAVPAFYF